jgi:hypothetical protein
LQDKVGGLQLVYYWARKLNQAECGNTYSTYDLDALAVCGAVKHCRCYLEGCSKLLFVTHHDLTATFSHATEQELEQTASTLPAGLATVCGFNDACVSQGSLERSIFVK